MLCSWGGLIEIDQVLIQIQPGGGQQGACVIMQVCCNTLGALLPAAGSRHSATVSADPAPYAGASADTG